MPKQKRVNDVNGRHSLPQSSARREGVLTATSAAKSARQMTVEHDIGNGTRLPAIPTNVVVILQLTNKSGLTSMPAIQRLPPQVHHVEFDPSCGCITEFESSTGGFLSNSAGIVQLDFTALINVKNFGNNFLRNMKQLQSVHLTWSQELTSIGDHFVSRCGNLKTVTVAPGTPASSITSIGNAFLEKSELESFPFALLSAVGHIGAHFFHKCAKLVAVDTSYLANVVAVGEGFLAGCASLKSIINLQFCSRLDTIPNGFLQQCSSLSTIDLTPISHVTAIGDKFLSGATSLRSVYLPFTALSSIGSHFLADNNLDELTVCAKMQEQKRLRDVGGFFLCNSSVVQTVDLAFLSNVSKIGEGFLGNCSGITTVDLSWFPSSITAVPNGFCEGLTSLKSINLSPLAHIHSIGDNFLQGAEQLRSVHLPFGGQLTTIGSNFLSGCHQLETISFSNDVATAKAIVAIGSRFFAQCHALCRFNVSVLSNVAHVGEHFLADCKRLHSLELAHFTQLLTVGAGFLTKCESLVEVDVIAFKDISVLESHMFSGCKSLRRILNVGVGFANVVEIGHCFAADCEKLENLDFNCLRRVKVIEDDFANFSGLRSLDLSSLVHLQYIGWGFLRDNTSLTTLHLPLAVPRGLVIEKEFLSGCTALTSVDLRFFACAHQFPTNFLRGCDGETLKEVKLPQWCELEDEFPVDSAVWFKITQVPWTWKTHALHTKGTQLAVLWLFGGGLQFQHSNGMSSSLPCEVAYEICQFIGMPMKDLPVSESDEEEEN